MGAKSQHLFNPCAAPKAQRLPAKIWELLRRNDSFRRDVDLLRAQDKLAKKETEIYSEAASRYNQALAAGDKAKIKVFQQCYDLVKDRSIRSETFRLIENYQKTHPLAALAMKWLVPEPLFLASRIRAGQIEDGTCLSPDLKNDSWIWVKRDVPQGAIGYCNRRGPEIEAENPDWKNWQPGEILFDCTTPWNRLPKSFKSRFLREWQNCYDSKHAYEFNYIRLPHKTDNLSLETAEQYLEFLETVGRNRLFAISPAFLTTKDVGTVFERLQNRIKKSLPESRDHLFGSEAAWKHYLAIKEKGLSLNEHVASAALDSASSTEIVRNNRKNVLFGVKAIEKLIARVYPVFKLKEAVLVHSAPPRDKKKRRKS